MEVVKTDLPKVMADIDKDLTSHTIDAFHRIAEKIHARIAGHLRVAEAKAEEQLRRYAAATQAAFDEVERLGRVNAGVARWRESSNYPGHNL